MIHLPVVVESVMLATVLELAGLWIWHRITGKGLPPGDYALSLLSGLLLMAALRSVLSLSPAVGAGMGAGVWVCLAASGVLHALDMRWRWLRARSISPRS